MALPCQNAHHGYTPDKLPTAWDTTLDIASDSGRLGYIDSPKSLTFESEVFVALVPVSQRDYAHPELLTETEWLAQHLNNPKVRIIDARSPQQYSAGHIPGAVN